MASRPSGRAFTQRNNPTCVFYSLCGLALWEVLGGDIDNDSKGGLRGDTGRTPGRVRLHSVRGIGFLNAMLQPSKQIDPSMMQMRLPSSRKGPCDMRRGWQYVCGFDLLGPCSVLFIHIYFLSP
jgi:hypothetical protein